jgi:NAD(P)-dependent dehydrogenase (short-subunit alcohol dehydrogenase family)
MRNEELRHKSTMHNPLDFSGKVVLVTGAAAGMGLATANGFAEAGAAVVARRLQRGRGEGGCGEAGRGQQGDRGTLRRQ